MNHETLFGTNQTTEGRDPLACAPPKFHGEAFDAEKDGKRLTRQLDMVRAIITGKRFWTLDEIAREMNRVYGKRATESGISARYRELAREHGGEKRRRNDSGLWEYRVLTKEERNEDE